MDPSDALLAIFLVALAGVLVLDVLDYAPKWRKWIGLGGLVAGTLAFVASKLSRHPKAPTPPRVRVPPPSIEPAARELRAQAMEAAREADAAQTNARGLTAEDIARRVADRAGKLLVILALLPGLAHAQAPPGAPMEYQGAPGVWYRLDMAQEVEGCIDAREADARRIRLLETELRLRVDDAASRQAREDALVAALEVSQETTLAAESDLRRARRRGRILLVVGLVVGLALPTGVVLAFR